jgi:hypothetical protein
MFSGKLNLSPAKKPASSAGNFPEVWLIAGEGGVEFTTSTIASA